MAENVVKTKTSTIQNDVDELVENSKENRFQLNVAKFKELRISFAKHSVDLAPILVNGEAINLAHTVKLLGLNMICSGTVMFPKFLRNSLVDSISSGS